MSAFNFFLLFSAIYYSAESAELPKERTVCKTREIWIPSGKVTQSGFINYEFPLSEGGKVVNRIIREECKSFVESTRVKRGALSHLASTVRKGFKILGKHKRKLRINPKPGREAGHLNRKGAVKNKYWRGPKPKPGTLLGAAMITGKLAKYADLSEQVVDKTGEVVETAIETIPEILESVRNKDSSSDEDNHGKVREENREEDNEEFRSNVKALLRNNTVEGHILDSKLVQQALGAVFDLAETVTASDVRCRKDEFTGFYSLRFRVDIPILKAVKIRNCGDIGILNESNYEYYDLLDGYILEKDGKAYAVNGSLCIETHEKKTGCLKSAFQKVSCSVMNVENCTRVSVPIEKKTMKRRLPVGGVYYGPAEMLFFNHQNLTFEFRMTPFHLEYLDIPEAVRDEMEENDFFF